MMPLVRMTVSVVVGLLPIQGSQSVSLSVFGRARRKERRIRKRAFVSVLCDFDRSTVALR